MKKADLIGKYKKERIELQNKYDQYKLNKENSSILSVTKGFIALYNNFLTDLNNLEE